MRVSFPTLLVLLVVTCRLGDVSEGLGDVLLVLMVNMYTTTNQVGFQLPD